MESSNPLHFGLWKPARKHTVNFVNIFKPIIFIWKNVYVSEEEEEFLN
jgi:hypothetical protein